MSLRAALDGPVRRLTGGRLYLAYRLDAREYVGRGDPSLPRYLRESQHWRDPATIFGINLEAAKYHWASGRVHDWSLVKRDGRMQYHVHGFRIDGGYDVASHLEYRPEPWPVAGETWGDVLSRVETHYYPTWGENYLLGEAPDDLLARLG